MFVLGFDRRSFPNVSDAKVETERAVFVVVCVESAGHVGDVVCDAGVCGCRPVAVPSATTAAASTETADFARVDCVAAGEAFGTSAPNCATRNPPNVVDMFGRFGLGSCAA